MRKFCVALVLCATVALGGCSTMPNPFASISTKSARAAFDNAELLYNGGLTAYNFGRDLCERQVIPPSCRPYVKKGRDAAIEIEKVRPAAEAFVDANPTSTTLPAVVTAFISAANSFDAASGSLKSMSGK